MALSPAQLVVLKADIAADPVFSTLPLTTANAIFIAGEYNKTNVPDFWVWRTSVPKSEIVQKTSRTNTNFIWAGNGFISRSAGEQTAWTELFNSTLTVNASLANVRQAFVDIFSGVGNAASNRAHLDAVSRRTATRVEKLFATGTGLDTAAGSATMTFEGAITHQDVIDAIQL